jgi:PmbA protein
MITDTQKELARRAMEYALKNGCQGARIHLYSGTSSSFEVRDMKTERLQQASEHNLSLRLFTDGRFGSCSTNRLDWKELEKFIRNAIESTRCLAEDRTRTLPDSARYYRGNGDTLQLCDPAFAGVPSADKLALAMQACEEITGRDARIVSAETACGDEAGFRYMIASNGFEGETSHSSFTLSASVSIRDQGDARPSSWWYDTSLYYSELVRKGIGTKALERTLRKLGQRRTASARMPMLVDFLNARRLLGPMISALYGQAIQQRNSFLTDRIGQKVAGSRMTLIDRPHLPRTAGARYFDGEGVATRQMPVFENGILGTYFIDTCYASKLACEPTIDAPSVLTMPAGEKNLEAMIASLDRGILVTGFNGGNCNSTTGDFSYGIEGFLIEKGRMTQPVNEMNITGNMLNLWSSLTETGNDALTHHPWHIPSLLFDAVDFSGI